jgi:hypothetical protein
MLMLLGSTSVAHSDRHLRQGNGLVKWVRPIYILE